MDSSRKRALQNDRTRLGEQGLARFDVLGREADRALIRALAHLLMWEQSGGCESADQPNFPERPREEFCLFSSGLSGLF